ncbi:TPA: hypothetical protein ACGO7F_001465 [Streptococcus suis]
MSKSTQQIASEITSAFHNELYSEYRNLFAEKSFAEHVADFYSTIHDKVRKSSELDPNDFLA